MSDLYIRPAATEAKPKADCKLSAGCEICAMLSEYS